MDKDVPTAWLDLLLVCCGGGRSYTVEQLEQDLEATSDKTITYCQILHFFVFFFFHHITRRFWDCTFHTTMCHVGCWSRVPWAAIVENNVWPALLRTAGRGSTHSSPSLAYRHSHRQSKGGAGWNGLLRVSPFSWACFCSASSSLSSSCVMASPLWKK